MVDLLDYLERFNRKERYFVIGMALGNPCFRLGPEFRERLSHALGMPVPEDAFVAMDYHLDWIYASLYLHAHQGECGPHSNLDKMIRAQQEDIDLIVAFQDPGRHFHIVFIEAKGDGRWSNRQMSHKAERLKDIFDDDGHFYSDVTPHFFGVSPRPSQGLDTTTWPRWMLRDGDIVWLPMQMGSDPLKVTRCRQDGHPAADGKFWRVIPARVRRPKC